MITDSAMLMITGMFIIVNTMALIALIYCHKKGLL